MTEGDLILIQKVCKRKECEFCGKPATLKHTFLLNGSRNNPASKAYGKDDCSWCEDDCVFICEVCNKTENRYKIAKEKDMGWCSTFDYQRLSHLFLYWQETKLDMPEKIGDLK